MKQLLTTAEVRDIVGGNITEVWVRERCADGTIPAYKIGRFWRIDRDELMQWIEAQRFVPSRPPRYEPARPVPTNRGSVIHVIKERIASDQD